VAGTGPGSARWWRRHGGAEEEDREVLMGRELSSLMAAGSTSAGAGAARCLLVLRFVLIVTMFSFVLTNNEVSQGCPEPLVPLLVVHGAHATRGGSGRVFSIDEPTRTSCRSMTTFVAWQKNRVWAVSSWV
jgi:hypothetical protein